ncbi:MAG: hypothetical protein CMI73_00100 [Candidatus Pelagibacter sp.]|mgnify:CR=1 FL=1|nr:hypothetical protein [Candidatus Pelagibacter sp.]OUV88655.1 MAG: hypothetical protein CBC96_00100 [Pelagibacteraceae bacterium TMED136]|tara:strand:+ start:5912 stop:6850 length:939 start_codon:yes stop_codon:yes gene_type:complete
MKFRLSIVGAGVIAQEYLKVLQEIKNLKVVGIHSRTKKKAIDLKKKFNIKKVHSSIEEMYEAEKPHGVIITTSIEETKNVLKECIKFNWKILVEKPVGYNLEEFYKIKKLIKKKIQNVYVAMNRNHFESTLMLKDEIKNRKIKRIIFVQDQENNLFKKNEYHKKVIKNWMYANSIHLIDYFRMFGRGQIKNVKTTHTKISKNKKIVNAEINFSSGDLGIYKCFWNLNSPWAVSIIYEDQRFELKPLEIMNYYVRNSKIKTFKPKKNDLKFKPGFKLQIDKFLKKIQGSKNKLLPDIRDSEFTMKLINQIYKK